MVKKANSRKEWRDAISNLVKDGAVKSALSWAATKLAVITTGPLGWVFTIILEQAWNILGDKLVRWSLRKGALGFDKVDGSIKAFKINKARNDDDDSSYDDAVDNVFN